MKNLYRYMGHALGERSRNGFLPVRIELGFDTFLRQELIFPNKENFEIGERFAFDTVRPRYRRIIRSNENGVWRASKVEEEWDRLYQYKCFIEKIYDGDTVTKAIIDLGFELEVVTKLRLYGIDTPELRGSEKEEGKKSRDRLKELVLNKEVVIETNHDDRGKYGRHLATIYLDGVNVNQQLIEEGFAKSYP